MCGRYTLSESPAEIAKVFSGSLHLSGLHEILHSNSWRPRYNIAPTQRSLVATESDKDARISAMRWGLIPHWAKDEKISSKLINARAETVADKPSFRDAFSKRRCLVFADGYYEWTTQDGVKRPIYIKPTASKIIAFAGIWATWRTPEDKALQSYSIITTNANSDLEKIHHRMPVVVPLEQSMAWISSRTPKEEILQLLQPSANGTFTYHFVSNYVNSPRNEGHECILPYSTPGT